MTAKLNFGFLTIFMMIICSNVVLADSLLNDAVYEGENQKFRVLVEQGENLNALDADSGLAPIHIAISNQNIQILRLIVKNNGDVNLLTSYGISPLEICISDSDFESFKLLIDAGAQFNTLNSNGDSFLQQALNSDKFEIARWLISNGVDVNFKAPTIPNDDSGDEQDWYEEEQLDYPLFIVLTKLSDVDTHSEESPEYKAEITKLLNDILAAGADLDIKDNEGNHVIFAVLPTENMDLILRTISKMNDIDVVDDFDNSPLLSSIKLNKKEVALALVEKTKNLGQADKIGMTALHLAYKNTMYDVVSELLKQDIKIAQPFWHNGQTVFHQALKDSQKNLLKSWLEITGLYNSVNVDGDSLLHLAIHMNDVETFEWLVKQGSSTMLANTLDQTPISLAVEKGASKFVPSLFSTIDKPQQYINSQTLLHLAAKSGDLTTVQMLMNYGADPALRDKDGMLAVDTAFSFGNKKILDYFVGKLDAPLPGQVTENADIFSDPRVKYWSLLFLADQKDLLLKSVENDLATDSPSILAAQIWTDVHEKRGTLADVLPKTLRKWNNRIDVTAQVTLLDSKAKYQQMIEQFPPDYQYSDFDLFGIVTLAYAAGKLKNYPLMYDYLEAGIRLQPSFWQFTWMYENKAVLNQPGFHKRAFEFANSDEVKGLPASDYIKAVLNQKNWGESDREGKLGGWLNLFPNDPRLNTAKAFALKTRSEFQEALPYATKAVTSFPFYSNRDLVTEILLSLSMTSQARAYSTLTASWYNSETSDEPYLSRVERFIGSAFQTDGDYGSARRIFEAALLESPNNYRLINALASLEMSDGRYAQAAELYRSSFSLKPEPLSNDYQNLFKALVRSGEKVEAFELAKNVLNSDLFIDENFYIAILEQATETNQSELLELTLQKAFTAIPESIDISLFKAKLSWQKGNKDEAFNIVDKLSESAPYNSLVIQSWAEYAPKDNLIETISARLASQPDNFALWELFVKTSEFDFKQKMDTWLKANRANNSAFAVNPITSLFRTEKKFREGIEFLSSVLSDMASNNVSYSQSDKNAILLNYLWLLESFSKQEKLSPDYLEKFQVALEQYRQFNLVNYYRYLESYYIAADDIKKASEAIYQRSLITKDETGIYHDLVAQYSAMLTKSDVQGYGYRMLQRNPYSKSILNSYLHKQLLWQGSPINALKAIENAKQKGIDYSASYERRALNVLGDTIKLYENYRILGERPAVSQRYIDWYERARNDALTKERKEIRYEFAQGLSKVNIVEPNGEITYREDHPIFGVVTRFRKGAAWIEIDYDNKGNMTSIRDSSGEFVNLKYDGQNHIARMDNSKNQVLEFSYNQMGKPFIIDMRGVGSIHVDYDDVGEINKVSSEQGHRMALRITQAFQDLISITQRVNNIYRSGTLPELKTNDPQVDALKLAVNNAEYGSQKGIELQLLLAEYLVENVGNSASYAQQADEILTEAYELVQQSDDKTFIDAGVKAVSLWFKLYKQFKPFGLPKEDYSRWSEMRLWLTSVSYDYKKHKKILQLIEAEPLQLLKDAHWLARSDINNSAFWKRFGNQDIYPKLFKGIEKQTLLLRNNGDIVLGTNKGLAVLRSGFWEWYGYDDNSGRFTLNLPESAISASSNILSLAETNDGVMWVGSASGLYAIVDDYDGELRRWRTAGQGLPSPRITVIKASKDSIYAGTLSGLVQVSVESASAIPIGAQDKQIDQLVLLENEGESPSILALSKDKLHLMSATGNTTNLAENVQAMVYSIEHKRLYLLQGSRLYAARIADDVNRVTIGEKQLLGITADLLHSQSINELQIWNVPDEGETLVVNTDLGTNILKDFYFQSMALPFELSRGGSQIGPIFSATAANNDIVLVTDEGLYSYNPSAVMQYAIGRVHDTLTDDKLGITYLAMGDKILYVDNSNPTSQPQYFSSDNAVILSQDLQGNLITHSGKTILRYKRGETSPQQLFSAHQNIEDNQWQGNVNDIFVDSNNTLWVAAGSSIFSYSNDMQEPVEYNYFIDPELFPSRSQMIYRVFENLENKIQVVASNESHLDHQGVSLSGGLLEWQNGKFINLGHEENWFVTGFTKINDETAIVATNYGFVRDKLGVRQSYSSLKDPTYAQLQEKSSMVWLGQKGVQLGKEGTWLFPSAGGLVVYHQGRWFYPDRLNQLLPKDQALGQYGARTVHSVSVDQQNRVYVATDIGLLVYESKGVASLLTDNHQGQVAFDDINHQQQLKVNDIFLNKLDPNSQQGKLVASYKALQHDIAKIETSVELGINLEQSSSQAVVVGKDDRKLNDSQAEALKQELKQRERSRQKLLANLEKNHFGLFQMLKMDPREISAMHKKLKKNQALIQYLPTPDQLIIQVVTSEGAVIRQVQVKQDALFKISLESAAILRQQVMQLDLSKTLKGIKVNKSKSISEAIEVTSDAHIESLRVLYHYLFRPIENDLVGKDQIFITPVAALTYVPFSALIRSVKPEVEYLVERYNIGVLPSMYHFNLVMQQTESFSDKALFIADPDGSLPGARTEVEYISANYEFEKTILEGDAATIGNIEAALQDARIVHFSTHGLLNSASPADSYLLLADGHQLGVIDISTMDLEQTDLVVLSACESGIGGNGLEYATLARAFAHAKVPSVVASYWMVHDEATKTLMSNMYDGLNNQNLDYFSAMTHAKKKMITAKDKFSHPAAWASFEVFGKP